MRIEDLSVGDVAWYWYDTGAFGHQMIYVKIVKVARKRVLCLWEKRRTTRWKDPQFIEGKLTKADQDILADLSFLA